MSSASSKKRKREEKDELDLCPPDDFHLHLRDGEVLKDTVEAAVRQFRRAIIMPNLVPPVTTTEHALSYRDRILKQVPENVDFTPLMTLYLTDKTSPEEIQKAKDSGNIYAVKLYPSGATTNSDHGVTDIKNTYPALKKMAEVGMLLLIHSEVTDPEVDMFDREAEFVKRYLEPLRADIPALKIVVEHISTKEAVDFVLRSGDNVGATVTPQHMLFNRNQLLQGGLKPHYYCLPILKSEENRKAVVAAVMSGSKKFFLGTDSAPHTKSKKQSPCGSAGCFSSFAALELYAKVFEEEDSLEKLNDFASKNGASFYGLPSNKGSVKLVRKDWTICEEYKFGSETVVPLCAGQQLEWKLQ